MTRRLFRLGCLLVGALGSACVGSNDDPSTVHDLRVLGMSFEPPELMGPDCGALQAALAGTDVPQALQALLADFDVPLQFQALIADPAGGGRDISYDVSVCANHDNPTCNEVPSEKVMLDQGTLQAGVFSHTYNLAATTLPDGTFLLVKVYADDPYHGLGGLWMPLVLHIKAGTEEIYAQQIMVFSCKAFPDSAPNVTPVLPGVQIGGVEWPTVPPPTVTGTGDVGLLPDDFTALQEAYVVPSFYLTEVHLTESWKISWYTTLGSLSPNTVGGTDLGGEVSKPNVTWTPASGATEQDVSFYIVTRDGRGGESWLVRTAHFVP